MAAANILVPEESSSSSSVKLYLSESGNGESDGISDDNLFNDLSKFKPKKILNNNSNRKFICVQGSFEGKEGTAILLLERKAFTETDVAEGTQGYLTDKSILSYVFKNDIYFSYELFPCVSLNALKTTIIFPATDKHIQKYSSQNVHIVNETADFYFNITLPHIEKEQFDLQWVYNILEHKTEADRITFEDPDPEVGFILLPDLKWDGKTLENLYLLALTHLKGVKSLRDLTSQHLALLKNIYIKGTEAIANTYKLPESQLRIYLHYQPSFYHLHVHFTYLKYEAPGISAERSHLLSNVISNIEVVSDYYQKVTLPFVVREMDNLFTKYEEKKILSKLPEKN